jgi:hypothetical protein
MQEVETYDLQKRLGYSDRGSAKLIFTIVMLITAGAVALLL